MGYSVDINALQEEIKQSGMTMTAIAKKADMNRGTLYNRMNCIGEFKASEIRKIGQALHLSDERRDAIFFAEIV